MNRLETVEKIRELEVRKKSFENILNDHTNFYNEVTTISCDIKLKSYNKEYGGEVVKVNEKLFGEYLKAEIEQLESEIKKYIEDLIL